MGQIAEKPVSIRGSVFCKRVRLGSRPRGVGPNHRAKKRVEFMTDTARPAIKLFQFPRMFAIPNLSPFCCKLETWLRMARIPYEVTTADPRGAPKGKLPFIEEAGVRIADTSLIIEHL